MSMKLTELVNPDGSKTYIQYDEEENDDLQAVGFIDNIEERTEKFKETMVNTIRGYSSLVLNAVKESSDIVMPNKILLEFGLQIGGETGVPFVTKGTAQANVKVSVEWDLNKTQDKQGIEDVA